MSKLTFPTTVIVFGLTVVYLAVKLTQFHYFLEKSEVRATRRETPLAFIVGEMALPIPAGAYMENYMLARMGRSETRSAAATTVILISESLVCFAALLILGVSRWWWLRPATGSIVGAALLPIAAFVLFKPLHDLSHRVLETGPLKKMRQGLLDALAGMLELATREVATRAILASVLYLTAIIAALMRASRGTTGTTGCGTACFSKPPALARH